MDYGSLRLCVAEIVMFNAMVDTYARSWLTLGQVSPLLVEELQIIT